jgi:hypothetical protein
MSPTSSVVDVRAPAPTAAALAAAMMFEEIQTGPAAAASAPY